jgi:hypothetical protein
MPQHGPPLRRRRSPVAGIPIAVWTCAIRNPALARDTPPEGWKCRAVASPSIENLLAEARYHRHRYDLYRAKMHGSRPTTMTRFREREGAV